MGEPLQLNLQFLLCKFFVGKTSCESLEWDLKEYIKTCVNEKVLLQALKLQFETSWRQKFQAGISTENKKKKQRKEKHNMLLPKAIFHSEFPFRFVEDTYFVAFAKSLSQNQYCPPFRLVVGSELLSQQNKSKAQK